MKKDFLRKSITVCIVLIAIALAGFAIYAVLHPESAAEKRQDTEESLAASYLEAVRADNASLLETSEEHDETVSNSEETGAGSASENTTETFTDDHYYSRGEQTYTPDYASGELLGVLEIDACQIRRGVYGGSWEDIQHDLDIWMVTEARPDYELGKTHFVIYGHNHPTQDLSFNRLKELEIGDVFTYTAGNTVWVYEVAEFIADWRDVITEDIVDNFELPADDMFIVTCGRGEYACKDIVYRGKLRGTVDITKYSEDPEYYKNDPEAFDRTENEEKETESAELPGSVLTVVLNEQDQLCISCKGTDGAMVYSDIGIYDMEGLPVARIAYPEEDTVDVMLEDGATYIAGVVRMEDPFYAPPADVAFEYHKGALVNTEIHEMETDDSGLPVFVKPLIFLLAAVIAGLSAAILWPRRTKAE